MDCYDVDARVGDYTPVRIKMRGREYHLADTAESLLALSEYTGKHFSDADGGSVLEHVRPLFRMACPEGPDDLRAAEVLALVQPLTEVLERLTRLTFRPASAG